MTIDFNKIAVGDTVTLKPMKVMDSYLNREKVIGCKGDGGIFRWITLDDIATHTPAPRPFAKGDRVSYERNTGTVISSDVDWVWVWVMWDGGDRRGSIHLSKHLTRLSDEDVER